MFPTLKIFVSFDPKPIKDFTKRYFVVLILTNPEITCNPTAVT